MRRDRDGHRSEGGLALSTVGRGRILAGRYRLEEQVESGPDGAVWRALDGTLDRLVSIRMTRPGHPFAADVADAARRAALVDDSRLVRVLDVGSDTDSGFVVSEFVAGETLESLVARAPLAAPVVRRLVGEAAESLSRAGSRGLHHLRLTPRSLVIRPDGTVKLLGTAVEAAAAGLEPDHAATASQVDAVGLVGLVYAGLTGRWPLGDAGFAPAERGEGGPVPPADVVADVPNDLDTLCAVTLGRQNDGPRTPAEVARQLAPWPTPQEAPVRPARGGAPARRPQPESRVAEPAAPAATLPPMLPTDSGRMKGSKRAAGAAAGPGRPVRRPPMATSPGAAPQPAPPAFAARAEPAATTVPARADGPALTPPAKARGRSARPAPDPTAPAGPQVLPAAAVPPGTKPPKAPRTKPRPKPPAARGQRLGTPPNGFNTGEMLLPWADRWTAAEDTPLDPLEQSGAFPLVITPEQPPREQSRLVILAVAVIVVLGLVFAVFSLRTWGQGSDSGLFTATPEFTPSATAPAPSVPASPAPASPAPASTTAPAGVAPQVAAIRALDPQGDDDENTADSPKAVDGDPSTAWESQRYNSAAFGGLKKGIGLSLKLRQPAVVRSVTITFAGSGGSVELRSARKADYTGSTVIAKGAMNGGKVTLTSTSAKPTPYVILWFTKLPSGNKLEISEVQVK